MPACVPNCWAYRTVYFARTSTCGVLEEPVWRCHHASPVCRRCHGCDESIFDADFVYEFGKSYHVEHFCCQICDANLTAHETFVPRGRKPYCFPCYGVHFADKCRACRKPINPTPGFGGKVGAFCVYVGSDGALAVHPTLQG